ncbi:uncharacterized protein LOC124440255 isoform X4 [Xenia sp. Carnegie-2017]|uniref:uncharacterized protein LOC124440255 isoform X4 n=1 Tax=Xenia sp. Carnegie-2017 TaxID=2897299 RepID=UPI001F043562|nr:uncharacterized protein LOC124440255 isoform X4 [Xenia sp. Carnegie-2017]
MKLALGLLLLVVVTRSQLPNICVDVICHRYATCNDGVCVCNNGYSGNGTTCLGSKICGSSQDDCSRDATCTDTGPGKYQCTCNEGFSGDGKSCSVVSGESKAVCEKVDIIFVLDKSGSIYPNDFQLMREFVISMGERLKVGERNSAGEIIGQAAIVTFSERGKVELTLKSSQRRGRFRSVVTNMPGPRRGGRTKTHRGLAVADIKVVKKFAGYREDDPNVVKIFMVITDGKQTKESRRRGYKYVREAMQPFFKRENLNVFAVGIGLEENSPAYSEVKDMVQKDENAFLMKTFEDLNDIMMELLNTSCNVPPKICGASDDCSPQATCADVESGKYECTCNDGYVGNGKFCTIPPICGTAEDDCHPSLANCTDTSPGAYKCKCVTGYIGDGKQCARDKICGTPRDDCHQFATCTDTGSGKYNCNCILGYSGNGKECIAIAIAFRKETYDVIEGDKKAIVEVIVETGEITTPLTVTLNTLYGWAGVSDFPAVTKNITFQPGQTGPIAVQIDINDDVQVESTEAFQVVLSNPSYKVEVGKPAAVNIMDDDEAVVAFSQTVYDIRENETAIMELSFTPGSSASFPVTLSLTTSAGSASDRDFFGKTFDVTFNAGETGPKRVEIDIVDDSLVESTESFNVSIVSSSSPAVRPGSSSKVNILDNDEARIGFTKELFEVNEKSGVANIGLIFQSGEVNVPVTVRFVTKTGTAGSSDFVSKAVDVLFEPGVKQKTVKVDLINDKLLEPSEIFEVSLESSSVDAVKLGKPSSVRIIDDDVASIGFTSKSYDVPEDRKAILELDFLAGEATEPVTVRLAALSGTAGKNDFISKEIDVTFEPGQQGPKIIEFDLIDDKIVESTESFQVALLSSSNKNITLQDPAVVNILDNDEASVRFESDTYDVKENETAFVDLKLDGEIAYPITVQLTTRPGTADEEDFVLKTVNVTFEPGQSGPKRVNFDIIDDKIVEDTESFSVVLASSVSAVIANTSATVNIQDNDEVLIGFTSNVYRTPESQNAFIDVEFISGRSDVPVTVSVETIPESADNNDFIPRQIDVVFGPGETGPKRVEVNITDDPYVESNERFEAQITTKEAGIKIGEPAYVIIEDNDEAVVAFSQSVYDIRENETAVMELSFTPGSSASFPVTLSLTTRAGSASDRDFFGKTFDVTFNAGETGPKRVEIDIVDDSLVESTESFNVSIVSSSSPAVRPGSSSKVNILDNDEARIGFTKELFEVNEKSGVANIGLIFQSGEVNVPVTVRFVTKTGTAGSSDFVSKAVDVLFEPGVKQKTVKVDLINDKLLEPSEIFEVSLESSSVDAVKLGKPSSVRIIDDDVASIGFTSKSYDVPEDRKAILELDFLEGEATEPVTVRLAALSGTAGKNDFISKEIDVTFEPRQQGPKIIEFDLIDDKIVENTESFQVALLSSSNKNITLQDPAVVNILDNDEASVRFESDTYDVKENETAFVDLKLDGEIAYPITVQLITRPGTADEEDFVLKTVNVTFEPGQSGPKRVNFDIIDDKVVEDTESFSVVLASSVSAVIANTSATVNIQDNDEVLIGFTSNVYRTPESQNAFIDVEFISGRSDVPVTVSVETIPESADNNDFIPRQIDVVFGPGETGPKRVEVNITDDPYVESNERFEAQITTKEAGIKIGEPAYVIIEDNDEVEVNFVQRSYDVQENEDAVVEIELSSKDIRIPVTVRLTTEPLTASSGKDYLPRTVDVTFEPGESGPKSITIPIINDGLVEPIEEFKVVMVSSSEPAVKLGSPTSVNIYLQDDDDAVVGFTRRSQDVLESENVTVEIGLASGNISHPVTISLETVPVTASGDVDFVTKTVNVTIKPGDVATQKINFNIINDLLVEGTERFNVSIKSSSIPAVSWTNPVTINILDDDEVVVQFKRASYSVRENEQPAVEIELSRGGVTEPTTIQLSTSPGSAKKADFVAKTVNVTFLPGEKGPKTVPFDIIDDSLVESKEFYYVNFVSSSSPAVKFSQPTVINIEDNDEAAIGFSKSVYEIPEDRKAVVNVKVTNGSFDIPVTVRLSASPMSAEAGKDFTPRELNVTFAPGENGPKFVEFDINDDDLLENPEEFSVSFISSSVPSVKLGQPSTVKILDNDEVLVEFSKPLYTTNENEKARVAVQLSSGKSDIPVKVNLQTSPNTAGLSDYSKTSVPVTFLPGESGPKYVEINITDDELLEDKEKFTVFLTSNVPRVSVGRPASVEIIDNEVAAICGTPQDDCHRYATCADTGPGEYSCTCNDGYTGDGKTCLAINNCETDLNDCGENASCINMGPGVHMCYCDAGYTGSGRSCQALSPAKAKCAKTDLILVLDRSGSIRPQDYELMRDFVVEIGQKLKIGERDDEGKVIGQGAIVTFSEEGTLRITLKESQEPGKFVEVAKEMPGPYSGGRTKTHKALKVANEKLVTEAAGLRVNDPSVLKVFMVITDGKQTKESRRRGFLPVKEAMIPFHNRKYLNVFAVGVGLRDDKAKQEVRDMVRSPANALLTESYEQLTESVDDFLIRFCPVPSTCGSKRDDCHPEHAVCKDTTPPNYECTCKDGYIGNGKKCVAQFKCATLADDCHPYLASCTDNGNGTYSCKCKPNYSGDGKTCRALDICGTDRDDCHEHATCSDTGPDSYKCLCKEGYQGDGKECTQVKICGTPRDDCSPYATCQDTGPGTYTCTCDEGYTGDGKTCTEIKTCGTPRDDCSTYATCQDTGPATYTCTCNEGYTGDGKTCTEIKTCGTPRDDCSSFATCQDTGPGTFTCTCNEGYTGDGKICTEIKTCGTPRDDCSPYATCQDTGPGTFTCTCNEGYTGDGKNCTEIKTCGTPRDDCSPYATCQDTGPATYTCTCNEGYTGDGKICTEIKTCSTPRDDCSPYATCQDTGPATYTCTCNDGYTGDGKICTEIKTCGTPRDDCSPYATCQDTGPGTFTCTCNEGYTGDGKNCTEIKTCSTPRDDCSPYATCQDTGPATYTCTCNEGYTGDGKICTEIKTCGTPRDDCSPYATCQDTGPATYTCTCNEGYTGDGKICTEIKTCGTPRDDCSPYATCQNTGPGTFTCTCNEGYTGDGKVCEGVTVTFRRNGYTVVEGKPALPEIIISADRIVKPITITLRTTSRSADHSDYTPRRVDIVFNPGDEGPKVIPINTTDDILVEPNEKFLLYLNSSSPGVTVGDPVNVTIKDNDKSAACKPKTDLIFVLDRSASIRSEDFDRMREFVKTISKDLRVGETNDEGEIIGQAAIVTFSEVGEKRITLAESQDKDKFYSIVDSMPGPLRGGRTKTHHGLALADKEVAIKNAGYREDDDDVKKMIMVITDGEQTVESPRRGYVHVGDAMKPFFNRKMDVFAIGVALETEAAEQEVRDMVQRPENAIITSNFNELLSRVGSIIAKFCPSKEICGTPRDDCSLYATCQDTGPDTYTCKCNEGYTGDGKNCTEIKTCGTPRDDCSPYATCQDTGPATYTCTCNEGYTGDGKTCTEIKTCGTPRDDCSPYATCQDTGPATYTCTCNEGYTGDGKTCTEIKTCGTPRDDCSPYATCQNTGPGTYTCTCNEGYTGDGKTCTEIMTCGTPRDDCSPYATCQDTGPATYTCTCNEGYTGDGKTCTEIKTCSTPRDDCSPYATCQDTGPATYTCTCNEGYTGDGKTCTEIKTCGTPRDDCSPYATCQDTGPATHTCTCNEGYTGDGKICTEIKTCGTPRDDCSPYATCQDTGPGTYTCTCNEGYTGDGKTCTEIKACGTPRDDCSPFATCQNTGPGTFTCTCNNGYSGDGKFCQGVSVTFKQTGYVVEEGKSAYPEVSISSSNITEPITITVTSIPNSAHHTDYLPLTVDIVFKPGDNTTKRIFIDTIEDDLVEPDEVFRLSISTSSPGVTVGDPVNVTIKDNDKSAACKPKTDLIFVLDRSASIRSEDFDRMREFVKTISKDLRVGETNDEGEIIGQAAIVTFSEVGEKRITLAESQDKDKFYSIVDSMPGPLRGGRTKTHHGLALADKEVAIKKAGYREDDDDVKKMMMVITDGEQTVESPRRGYVYVGDAMKPFFNRKMDVFAIGVALETEAAEQEVRDMVQRPENAIITSNFNELLSRVGSIIAKFCPTEGICGTPRDDCSPYATCKDTGSDAFTCTCNEGYTGDGKTCTEIKTCGTSRDDCSPYATCQDTGPATYTCTCNEGYTGDGKICTEIKTCGTPRDDCSPYATCQDTGPGTYTCTCNEGYTGDGKTCTEIKTCGTSRDDCSPYATCQDTGPGTYTCTCNEGYTGDGKTCTEIKTCGTPRDDCSPYATCQDTGPGTYTCTCNEGYTGDGKTCTEIKTCGTSRDDCSPYATCQDTGPGTYTCTCNEGYTGDGKTCTEIKTCGTSRDDCSPYATCQDTGPGTYTCICNEGYTGDGKTCTEIKTCGTPRDDCSPYATCQDTGPGTYTCTCNEGYTGDGKTCTEIKTCGTSRDDCSPYATCQDTGPGTYTCTCNEGYTGDGKTCTEIKTCGTPRDDCSPYATCQDTGPGTYTCTCNEGYTGDGKTCTEIKTCGTPRDDCSPYATCQDTGPGTYTCTCNEGYTGDGKTCTEINMCSGNNHDCHKMANCRPLAPGNYSCTCIDGYEGDGKNCRGNEIFGPVLYELKPKNPSTIGAAWRLPDEMIRSDVIDYLVCYKDINNGGGQCKNSTPPSPNSPLVMDLTDLVEETTYEVFVRARNASGYGPPSNALNVTTPPSPVKPCVTKTDTIFVVDKSSGLSKDEFEKIRSFISRAAKRLGIGMKNKNKHLLGQAAIVAFSKNADKVISLKDSGIRNNFAKAVRQISLSNNNETNTHRGLEEAYRNVAVSSEGLRSFDDGVHKTVVVITHGHQTNNKGGFVYVGDAAKAFFKRGIDIIAIGIGLDNDVAKKQLIDMVRTPENAFLLNDASGLSFVFDRILPQICPKNKICGSPFDDCHPKAICFDTSAGKHKCICRDGYAGNGKECFKKNCKFDIGFLVDSSSSMKDCNYDGQKKLINNIAEQFQVASNKSHASVILYSEMAAMYKNFNRFYSLKDFQMLVKELPMISGPTHLDQALDVAATKMFSTKNGMREESIPKLLFVLTDGVQSPISMKKPLEDVAATLKSRNIHIVVIGSGEADKMQLSPLVKSSSDLIMVKKFEDAIEHMKKFSEHMCSADRCSHMKLVVPVKIQGCKSSTPVKIGVCMGKCATGPSFSLTDEQTWKLDCQTCKPRTVVQKSVLLTCPGNIKRSFKIRDVTSCHCEKCPWKRL